MTETNLNEDNRAGHRENVSGHTPFYTVDSIDLRRVVDGLRIDPTQRLILGLGPCRVGTKAQLFTMAATGYDAFEQPMKGAYRCLGQNMAPEDFCPSEQTSYLKETVGPYTPGESKFNPISLLRRATGQEWMHNRLDVIVLLRDPYDTWHSWSNVWGNRLSESQLFANYVMAWETTRDIALNALDDNLSIRSFDYRLNQSPESSCQSLFSTLDLDQTPVIDGWSNPEIRDRLESHFISFKEPEVFLPQGIRKQALASDGLHHQSYTRDEINRKNEIQRSVEPIYEECLEQLPSP